MFMDTQFYTIYRWNDVVAKKMHYIIVAKCFNKQLKPTVKMIDIFLEKWETLYAFKEILLKYKEIGPINPSTS